MEYVVDDCFEIKDKWFACVRTTVKDADNFPIKEGDILEGGLTVLKVEPFHTSFNWQVTNKQSVALILDRKVAKGTVLKKESR